MTTPDSGPAEAPVLLTTEGAVATVTLNRPGAMNGLDVATKVLLRDTLADLAANDDVRCVVLTGTGRAFCVGQDLKEHVQHQREGRDDLLGSTVAEHYNPTVTTLLEMPKPVVAAVNGVAAGAGASLAMACDLRLVADTAGFNFAFAGVGLSCDTGSSLTLPRLVGHARAAELLFMPRTVDAEESLAIGLANRVVPAGDLAGEAATLAARLAAGPTVALASIKASLAYAATHELADVLAFEGRQMRRTGDTEDHAAAVASFLAKEKPTFTGR
ncbi:enoyl-CoA hydratase-related protein [Nocardioides lentus]|uniref:Enoyl-CoA hydratase-related protein n=1 Tax=Nocardioides lentus TaxID=338077 RepID=A0ABP5ANK8_9ACTN